jgi:hypothetical protein
MKCPSSGSKGLPRDGTTRQRPRIAFDLHSRRLSSAGAGVGNGQGVHDKFGALSAAEANIEEDNEMINRQSGDHVVEIEYTVIANPYDVEVTFTTSRETFEGISGRKTGEYAGACSAVMAGSVMVIGVFDGSRATLVHECVHGSIAILQRARINPFNDDGEVHAYLTDWLWSQGSILCDVN